MPKVIVLQLFCGSELSLKATATLIIDNELCMLIDPGIFVDSNELDELLRKKAGIQLSDINTLFYTHLHFDHYNYLQFSHVKTIYISGKEIQFIEELEKFLDDSNLYLNYIQKTHEIISSIFLRQFIRFAKDRRYDLTDINFTEKTVQPDDNQWIGNNVQVVFLEGHSPGHMGVKVFSEKRCVVVCGDAINSLRDYKKSDFNDHLILHRKYWWLNSRKKISKMGALVIPGHGNCFDTVLEKEVNLNTV